MPQYKEHKNVRVSQKNILSGIRHAEIMGKHRLERQVNVVGPNVRPPKLTEKQIEREKQFHETVSSKNKLDYKKAAENEFMAEASDMRGKKQSKVFRGNRVYEWNPKRDFRPDAVGYVQGGGAFKGGFINEALGKNPKGYIPNIGHQKGKVCCGGETMHNVNPFSIKLRVKPTV